jgi:hypothetical protein
LQFNQIPLASALGLLPGVAPMPGPVVFNWIVIKWNMVQPGCDDFQQRTHVGVGCFLRFTTAASRDLRARGMTSFQPWQRVLEWRALFCMGIKKYNMKIAIWKLQYENCNMKIEIWKFANCNMQLQSDCNFKWKLKYENCNMKIWKLQYAIAIRLQF